MGRGVGRGFFAAIFILRGNEEASCDSLHAMKRPFTVTFLGSLFIVVGLVSTIYHLLTSPLDYWMVPVSLVGIIAIVGGVFLIKGRDWARWLMLSWLAFHVFVSALHSLSGSMAHLLLLIAVGYFLLTPPDSKYFGSAPSK
jgi:uncharacterized membrane protein